MEISLPKSDTTDQTGDPRSEWESIDHVSKTQREAIIAFEIYISKLSEKLKEIHIKTSASEERLDKTEEKIEKINKTSERIMNLVIFGFFALLIVVIGIAFGYWQFIFTASKNEDYKYGLSEKVNNNLNEIKKLKLCLNSNKWLNPKCLED